MQFIRETTGQKQREILINLNCVSVLCALLVSVVLVLYSRLAGADLSTTWVLTILLSLALLTAGIMTRRRRPDDLQVAVLADIKLRLKQRLSTAWEFARTEPGSEVTQRLAVQAIKQRLPLRSEPVFPLRINTWGKLVPIVIALLVLVSVVDLEQLNDRIIIEQDETVVDEGKRLREFAEQLGGLAKREQYPRSAAVSEKMHRVGARMESGALSRRDALGRLRQLGVQVTDKRNSALYDGAELPMDVSEMQTSALTRDLESLRVRSMLRSLLDGRLSASDARSLSLGAATLSQLGIDSAALERALESFDAGNEEDLLQILEKLAGIDIALQDAESLSEAQAAVERARENLGDPSTDPNGDPSRARGGAHLDGDGNSGGIRADAIRSAHDPSGMGPGAGYGLLTSEKSGTSQGEAGADDKEAILRPKSQLGVGDVFSAEARVLPRVDQPSVDTLELDVRFAAQMEEVLSRENYPLHHKEFIRRYFLGLSVGADPQTATDQKE